MCGVLSSDSCVGFRVQSYGESAGRALHNSDGVLTDSVRRVDLGGFDDNKDNRDNISQLNDELRVLSLLSLLLFTQHSDLGQYALNDQNLILNFSRL